MSHIEMEDLFRQAEDWVYGYHPDKPSEEVYQYLSDNIGPIPDLYNIANEWGYVVPTDTLGKLDDLWNTTFRPPYLERALGDRKMTEEEYSRYMFIYYMVPKYLKKEAYVEEMSTKFPMPDTVISSWNNHVDNLPKDVTLVWQGLGDIGIPVSEAVASVRTNIIDTIIKAYGTDKDRNPVDEITIDNDLIQSLLDNMDILYPGLDTHNSTVIANARYNIIDSIPGDRIVMGDTIPAEDTMIATDDDLPSEDSIISSMTIINPSLVAEVERVLSMAVDRVSHRLETPINGAIASMRLGLLDTIINIYGDDTPDKIIIGDGITQSFMSKMKDIYPDSDIESIISSAMARIGQRIDPGTTDMTMEDAIGTWLLYDILGSSATMATALDMVIASNLAPSNRDKVGALLGYYEHLPDTLENTRRVYDQ